MRSFTLFFLTITLLLPASRAEVRIVGCDLLGGDFTAALNAYSKRNDLGLRLNLSGSESGLEKLRAGLADIGIIMLGPDEKKPGEPFVVVPVAYQTAAVVVPASLPLTQVTFAQLNGIYADAADGSLKRWGDLGVAGEWANRNILPSITGSGGGLSYDLFRHTVLSAPTLKPTVAVQDDVDSTLQRIKGDEGGIAIMPLLPDGQTGLKALLVARGAGDVAFGPTQDNVFTGDYPIRLPLYLVFKKGSAKNLQLLLRYLLSEDAVPLWKGAQLMPLPIQARNQQIFDLEVL